MTTADRAGPLKIVTVVPSLARNTGGPAVTIVQGTRAMGGAVRRVIYATDAAQPAGATPFRRVHASDLPDGAREVPIRLFRTRQPYKFAFAPRLWAALQRAIPNADLVTIHSVNLFPQLAAFTTALRAKVPYVVTPHGSLDPWLEINSPRIKRINNAVWQRRMLSHASAIHFTTEEEAELAAPMIGSTRRVIVPNGLDVARFQAASSGESFREQHLDGYSGHVVLFMGRISRKKGIDLLIRGFASAVASEDAMLVIAGPDDERLTPELLGVADAVGVRQLVRFVGPVYGDDQLAALAATDVWSLTSHTENFGNAVVEAMAAGCAVLVSNAVNLAAQIEAAEAGVVTGLDIDEIARGLKDLLRSPERRRVVAAAARAFVQPFDWSVVAPELVHVFQRIVSDHASSRSGGV